MTRTALLICGLAALGCNKTVNTDKGEEVIAKRVTEATGLPVTVDCPDGVKVEQGSTFDCQVKFEGGHVATARVTQTDNKGNVTWDFTREVLVSSKLEAQIVDHFKGKGIEATADCGPAKVRTSEPGSVFDCKVRDANAEGRVQVTVKDDKGNIAWEVVETK